MERPKHRNPQTWASLLLVSPTLFSYTEFQLPFYKNSRSTNTSERVPQPPSSPSVNAEPGERLSLSLGFVSLSPPKPATSLKLVSGRPGSFFFPAIHCMWQDQKDPSSARTEPAGHVEIGAGPGLVSPSPPGHSASPELGG